MTTYREDDESGTTLLRRPAHQCDGKNDNLPDFAQFFDLLPKNLEDAFSHHML